MPQLDGLTPQHSILYLNTGVGVFGGIGDPNGVEKGGIGSLYTNFVNGNLYIKTTSFDILTGWTLVTSGGGSGTVTNFSAGNLSPLFNTSVTNPTTTPSLSFAQISQAANKIFASPNGSAGVPTFRNLVSADLSLAAAPPANGIQYNDGTNAFTASNGFKVDPATNTLQIGELNVLKGTLQLQAGTGGGSFKITTNVPTTNHTWILPDAAPTVDQLLKVIGVSGANYTLGYISPSGLGFASVNPTSGVLPYNNAGSFADSPIQRISSTIFGFGSTGNDVGFKVDNTFATPSLVLLAGNSTTTLASLAVANLDLASVAGNAATRVARLTNASGGNIVGCNAFYYGCADNNNGTSLGSASVALQWRASGMFRIGNGSTGAGQLGVGTSTMTTANQFTVDSQSTTRIAGFFSMPNGSSVATIQGVTNSIQSFAFNPSGKLVGACNIPTSNQQFSTIGNMKSDVSEAANVGAGNTNLLSFSLPANSIVNVGDTVEFKTTIVYAANANNKRVECLFGGVSLFLISDLYSGSQGEITVRIKRTSATTAKTISTYIASDVLLRSDCQYIDSAAITWSSANTFQVKGQATSNNDIINKELESNVIIALTS